MTNTITGLSHFFVNSSIINNLTVTAGALDLVTIAALNSNCSGLLNLNGPITLNGSIFAPVISNVTLAGGAVIVDLNDAYSLAYTPAVPGNWTVPPTTVQSALDMIAASLGPI